MEDTYDFAIDVCHAMISNWDGEPACYLFHRLCRVITYGWKVKDHELKQRGFYDQMIRLTLLISKVSRNPELSKEFSFESFFEEILKDYTDLIEQIEKQDGENFLQRWIRRLYVEDYSIGITMLKLSQRIKVVEKLVPQITTTKKTSSSLALSCYG